MLVIAGLFKLCTLDSIVRVDESCEESRGRNTIRIAWTKAFDIVVYLIVVSKYMLFLDGIVSALQRTSCDVMGGGTCMDHHKNGEISFCILQIPICLVTNFVFKEYDLGGKAWV